MATTDPRFRGFPFMAPLVQPVLRGDKDISRRTGRKPAEVGDLLWIRERWRTLKAIDHRPFGEDDPEWWLNCHWRPTGPPEIPPVWYAADHPPDYYPGVNWGRPRQARFLPRDLARPWRGRVVSVERVPAPPEGIDDDEAIREGARLGRPDSTHAIEWWTLDGHDFTVSPSGAFFRGWDRLHPDPSAVHAGGVPGHVWRVEWVTEVTRG